MIKPKEVIDEFLKGIEPKSVLDLGCGLGRVSLRFAEKGIKVKGVDSKERKTNNENFKFIKRDIREFAFEEKYDLIIASLILHFLKKEEALAMIERMKDNTQKCGFNFLVCLSDKDDCSKQKPGNFYPNGNDIRRIYSDWGLIKFDQDFTEIEEHDNLKPHRHNIILLLARKEERIN